MVQGYPLGCQEVLKNFLGEEALVAMLMMLTMVMMVVVLVVVIIVIMIMPQIIVIQ